ncbi:MAG: RCC1 domain-containing protein, partial [Candidatus Thermoplasmatota archaeon]|nr:RCC1 domain-containing protein [Candidatus Thermoplasmatota archaeon]
MSLRARACFCLAILLGVSMQVVAEESTSLELDCPNADVNQAESMECSIDLSEYVGVSTIRYEFVPTEAPASETHSSVLATGSSHTCAILENGSAMCWGLDNYGQLGDGGDATNRNKPTTYVSIEDGQSVTQIYAKQSRTCIV